MHIIEPTLKDQTGHCFSLLNDLFLADTSDQNRFEVWLNRRARVIFAKHSNVVAHRFFTRRARRLQVYFLYRKFIKNRQPFFVSTATSTDLLLLGWTLGQFNCTNPSFIRLYIHWLYREPKRMRRLQRSARLCAQIPIACPTEGVQEILHEAGFEDVEVIPYPRATWNKSEISESKFPQFKQLLFAGAARVDKGFPLIVELVARLQQEKSEIPIAVQCSTTHKGKHSAEILFALQKLQNIHYKPLRIFSETLSESEYKHLFANSIVLQPYDVELFSNRVSGVSLDALTQGSPIIAPAGTWMAELIQHYRAGTVVDQADDVDAWFDAVKATITAWPEVAQYANQARQLLQVEHKPSKLLDWLGKI